MKQGAVEALPWLPVQSSSIARVAWQDEILYVHFLSDGEAAFYRYEAVPEETFHSLYNAHSVGKMHAKVIKGKFLYQKIEVEPDDEAPDVDVARALDRVAERLISLEAVVGNLERLILGALRPRKPVKEA